MNMYRFVILMAVLFAGSAMAQQVDVSGKDFLSGAGDAKLAQIASEAAAAGKGLSVTAPDYWQAKVAAKLHAGAADVPIHAIAGFFENVLVRVEEPKSAATAKPPAEKAAGDKAAEEHVEAQKAAAAKAAAEQAAEQAAQAAAARAAAERAAAERAAAVQAAAKAAEERQAMEKAAAEKAAAEKAAAQKAAAEKAAADKLAAIRHGMEQNLNGGKPAEGTLQVGQLQRDDVVYVDGTLRGVVRRDGSRNHFFWLDGELNLDRIELMPNGDGRYKVLRSIDANAAPVLRSRSGATLNAAVPAADAAVRKSLQDSYAEGRDVVDSLEPSGLRQGDLVYTGPGAALVVRRSGGQLARYWLVGSLDLGQIGLKNLGGNAYRALSDTIK